VDSGRHKIEGLCPGYDSKEGYGKAGRDKGSDVEPLIEVE